MARMISKRVLEEIRFGNDIVDVLGSYLTLKKMGATFKCLCPFHKEKTPSFHVNPQRQIYHCFGCGAGGDVFGFLQQYEGVDFVTAVKILAERAGIAVELDDDDGASGQDKAALYRLLADVAALYHRALRESKNADSAREYVDQRKLDAQTLEDFSIGFAPDRWDGVLNWACKKKFSVKQIEDAGLIVKAERPGRGTGYYDRFRNRLMFPIRDEQSRVVGFSGRSLEQSPKAAKYVNSPETALFRKGRILYALEKGRREILETREAVVCEGQIDVIRCHQAGIKTAVAAQGTAFTEDQVRILRRYADSAVIVFDPDHAGQDAAIRTAGLFLGAGLAVKVAALPRGEDPDSFILKNGADAFRAVLAEAESAVGYQVRILSEREDTDSEVGVMRVAKAVLKTISASPSAVHRAHLVQEAAECLKLPVAAIQDDLRFVLRTDRSRDDDARPRPDAAPRRPRSQPKEEVALCEHLVHAVEQPALAGLVKQYLPLRMFSDPHCRAVADAALGAVDTQREILDVLREKEDDDGDHMAFAAEVIMAPAKIKGIESSREQAIKDLILYIWRRELEKERSALEKMPESRATPESLHRRTQLTYDLKKALRSWETGMEVIELELSD